MNSNALPVSEWEWRAVALLRWWQQRLRTAPSAAAEVTA